MTDIEPAVTVEEMMLATGKSRATVYRMLAAGDIPSVQGKHGGRVVTRPAFRRYLENISIADEPTSLIHHRRQRAGEQGALR